MPLHRNSSQLQAGNPAFGAGFQCGDVFCREVQSHHLVEKLGGFRRGKTQVDGAQLGQLAPGAEPGQGKLWILTGGDDQVHLRRQVLDQKGEGLVDRFGLNQVVVVKDEDEASGRVVISLIRAVRSASAGGGWGNWSTPTHLRRYRQKVCKAATR